MRSWGKGALVTPVLLGLALLVACNGGTSLPLSPVPGVAELCQPLAQLKSHRYTFSYTLESPQPQGDVDEAVVGEPPFALQPASPDFFFSQAFIGAIENPDKLDVTSTTVGAEGEIRYIFIGNDQWVSLGDTLNRTQGQSLPFPPVEMCNAMVSGLDLTGVTPTAETIDGVDTLRYEVEDAELDTAVTIWAAQSDPGRVVKKFTVTVWLSEEDNVPVRLESRGLGIFPGGREITTELTLEVSDINAGDIKIEPPS